MDDLCTRTWFKMTDISLILVSNFVSKYQFYYFTSDYHWFITRNISDTAVREMRSERRGQGLVPELGLQYNNFPVRQSGKNV